jgi:hypothetical protein
MKKVILTVATVLTMGLVGHSQCSVKVSTNEYTQEKTIKTGFLKFRSGMVSIEKVDSIYVMCLMLNSSIYLTIDKGDVIYLKLENGSVVKIYNESTSYGDYSTYSGNYNILTFILDNDIINKLKESSIVGIKCSVNEYNITSSFGKQLQDNFKCITEFN